MLLGCGVIGIRSSEHFQCCDNVDHIDDINQYHDDTAASDNIDNDHQHDDNDDYNHDDRATS
jgi:hypothetical protein